MTQQELAAASGIHQPTISAIERGTRMPEPTTVARLLTAAGLRPSIALEIFADRVRASARGHRMSDVRVFGSSVYGTDTGRSDVDLLVRMDAGATFFDLAGFQNDVAEIVGFPVDVVVDTDSEGSPEDDFLRRIRAESVPV